MLNVNHAKHIQENQHYLTAILKSILLCCRQGIAFRGHREDLTNTKANPGNFLAVLGIVSEYDKIVSSRLLGVDGMGSKNPYNAKYKSNSIQNELISIAADIVLETNSLEVRTTKYFSPLCDECKGSSKTEQMSVVLRYVTEYCSITESCIGLCL